MRKRELYYNVEAGGYVEWIGVDDPFAGKAEWIKVTGIGRHESTYDNLRAKVK